MSSPSRNKRPAAQKQQQSQNSKDRRVSGNAFEILMTNSKSSSSSHKRQQKSRFVLCPAGCGNHILENKINLHLDQCIITSSSDANAANATASSMITQKKKDEMDTIESKAATTSPSTVACTPGTPSTSSKANIANPVASDQQEIPTPPNHLQRNKTDEDGAMHHQQEAAAAVAAPRATGTKKAIAAAVDEKDTTTKGMELLVAARNVPYKKVSTAPRLCNNVFEHMMKQSKAVFSQPKKSTATTNNNTYYFCLHGTDGRVSLGQFPPMDLNMTWSTKVRVRDVNNNNNSNSNGTTMMLPVILGTCVSPPPQTATTTTTTSWTDSITPMTAVSSLCRHRLVRHHSRLSVPVLKSMLQKCIRRRRPMPAVRIAMELADKSLNDLLRRLPIIILEDSTLHPDFPLLVWLMMACSSSSSSSNSNNDGGGGGEYTLPPVMMQRVLQIIYEAASCQWIDPLPPVSVVRDDDDDLSETNAGDGKSSSDDLSLLTILKDLESSSDSLAANGRSHSSNHVSCLLIWSLLARASYGGMKCDVLMLKGYARQWKRRFSLDAAVTAANAATTQQQQQQQQQQQHQQVHKQDQVENQKTEMDKRVTTATAVVATTAATTSFPSCWSSLLTFVHERARQQSRQRVTALFDHQQQQQFCLDRLALIDTCLQGVDYHCCFGILDHLLSDLELVHLSLDLLSLSSNNSTTTEQENVFPKDPRERRSHLADVWKSCMWKYSSGVNNRLPISVLLNNENNGSGQSMLKDVNIVASNDGAYVKNQVDPYKELWSLAAPKVLAFQKHYVQQRLA